MSERRGNRNTEPQCVVDKTCKTVMIFIFYSYFIKKNVGWLYPLSAFNACDSSAASSSALGYILQSTHLIEMSDKCRGVNLTD